MAKWDSNQWTRTNIHSMLIRVSLSVCVSWVCVCVCVSMSQVWEDVGALISCKSRVMEKNSSSFGFLWKSQSNRTWDSLWFDSFGIQLKLFMYAFDEIYVMRFHYSAQHKCYSSRYTMWMEREYSCVLHAIEMNANCELWTLRLTGDW